MTARLVSVNVAAAAIRVPGSDNPTGIDKRPVPGPVQVTGAGIAGDTICSDGAHGGHDQAVYAFAREDAAWWEAELGRQLPPGRFGENLSTGGLDITGAVIGERWRLGAVLLEVSFPRIPCRTFAGFWGVPDLIRRFTARAAPGAYLRVLVEGRLAAGDVVTVEHRPAHGVTVGEAFRAMTTAPDLLPRLLEAPQLPADKRARVRRRLQVG